MHSKGLAEYYLYYYDGDGDDDNDYCQREPRRPYLRRP